MEFGELKDVDLREAWTNEATSFTPWLAKNLERLSRVIGIELEAEGTEVAVEGFAADILARNPMDGSRVLIENQLEGTDHRHLGQILTYLAGLEAETVIWVAREFHGAHLSAIRWLNEHTVEPFAFFAVRVRVLKIGDDAAAPVAPLFEVLERPSEWDRRVRTMAREENVENIERRQFRREFWGFYAGRYPDDRVSVGATSNQWVYVEEADLNISLALVRNKVGLFLRGNRGENTEMSRERILAYEEAFRNQFPHWPADEPIYDCAEWSALTNSHERSNWPQMADWLHEHLEIYRGILTQDPA